MIGRTALPGDRTSQAGHLDDDRGDVPRVVVAAVVASLQRQAGVGEGAAHADPSAQAERGREPFLDVDVAAAERIPDATRTLALELAPIRVNLIAAGFVPWPLTNAFCNRENPTYREDRSRSGESTEPTLPHCSSGGR